MCIIKKSPSALVMELSFRFVEAVLNSVIEKNEKARVQSGQLISNMLSRGLLGEVCTHAAMLAMVLMFSTTNLQGQFLSALDSLLQYAEDLLVDIPKFWDFLAQVDHLVQYSFVLS